MSSSRSPPPSFHTYSPSNLSHHPSITSHHSSHSQARSYAPSPAPSGTMQHLLQHQDQYAHQHQLHQQQQQYQQQVQSYLDVGDDEYNRLLKNYKLAHIRIEDQRIQMLEQEKQNALLRKHIGLLQGGEASGASVVGGNASGGGGATVDDFTIKNSSSTLERRINRWAADTLSAHTRAFAGSPTSPGPGQSNPALIPLAEALLQDIPASDSSEFLQSLRQSNYDYPHLGLVVQSLLRHVMSQLLAEGIVNELLVTNSEEANRELTKLHEQLFNREPLVASVWRRQTFSAAVATLDPAMALSLFSAHMPAVFRLVNPRPNQLSPPLAEVLEAAYTFSRMLHASRAAASGGAMEAGGFYRAFVPELGSALDPTKLELIKKCYRTERGEPERVGACLFPGLVKESAVDTGPMEVAQLAGQLSLNGEQRGAPARPKRRETRPVVVRRAQVICECALAGAHGMHGSAGAARSSPH